MIWRFLFWAWQRFRPRGGWVTLILLVAIMACLLSAVLEAEWVAEGSVVIVTIPLGLLFGIGLAHRPIASRPGWGLIVGYGWLVNSYWLSGAGRVWQILWHEGWVPAGDTFRQQVALFADRLSSWFQAAQNNQQTTETIVFAFGLGLAGWLLAAYVAWATYRHYRPLSALGLIGFGLAANSYYGKTEIWPAVLFVSLAVALLTITHYTGLEQNWEQRGIDYSLEIRLELLFVAGGMSLALLALSFALPGLQLSSWAKAFQQSAGVKQVEQNLERLFAGVSRPQPDGLTVAPNQPGVWPRAILLGQPPELASRIVMTATTSLANSLGSHWRVTSYDRYTGQGWSLSDERQEDFPAGANLPLTVAGTIVVSQTVHWLGEPGNFFYTLGQPRQFNRPVRLVWRGLDDLVRVEGAAENYTALSQLVAIDPAGLDQASLAQVPPALLARYTQLPEGIPGRVANLAQTITAPYPTPYQQARALERFLRQYPYTLAVSGPPAGSDPVDYFLFELQKGYCDYYASAMVVMARQVGLPARLAIGYLPSPPNEAGVQLIRGDQAHAWAEIYFAGYGWLEFEPTAAFPVAAEGLELIPAGTNSPTPPAPLPIPPPTRSGRSWLWLVLVAIPLLGGLLWWRAKSGKRETGEEVYLVYGRLLWLARRLGQPTPAGQTPTEFEAALLAKLENEGEQLRPGISQIVWAFVWRQYSGRPEQTPPLSPIWSQIRRPLWWLWLSGRRRTP